jgi:hypothetical protein
LVLVLVQTTLPKWKGYFYAPNTPRLAFYTRHTRLNPNCMMFLHLCILGCIISIGTYGITALKESLDFTENIAKSKNLEFDRNGLPVKCMEGAVRTVGFATRCWRCGWNGWVGGGNESAQFDAANEEQIGTIAQTCDPSGTPDFPKGYLFDLSFVKLAENLMIFMKDVENMAFVEDYTVLPYNKLIRLVTPDPPFRNSSESVGGTFGPLFGTTIGQAIVLSNEKYLESPASKKAAKEHEPSLKFQLSRATLWRTYGAFKNLQGWSGSPLELARPG